jgi:hypothetical protein
MLFLDVKFCLKIEMSSNNNLIKILNLIYIYFFLKEKKRKENGWLAGHPRKTWGCCAATP